MASSSVIVDSKGIKALSERIERVTDNLSDANALDRRAGRWGPAKAPTYKQV